MAALERLMHEGKGCLAAGSHTAAAERFRSAVTAVEEVEGKESTSLVEPLLYTGVSILNSLQHTDTCQALPEEKVEEICTPVLRALAICSATLDRLEKGAANECSATDAPGDKAAEKSAQPQTEGAGTAGKEEEEEEVEEGEEEEEEDDGLERIARRIGDCHSVLGEAMLMTHPLIAAEHFHEARKAFSKYIGRESRQVLTAVGQEGIAWKAGGDFEKARLAFERARALAVKAGEQDMVGDFTDQLAEVDAVLAQRDTTLVAPPAKRPKQE
eukprot:Sspe_Gene.43290::Locus_21081_Transcript_1_1_Confidence_1.000_Length_992::g.43290::m.43290